MRQLFILQLTVACGFLLSPAWSPAASLPECQALLDQQVLVTLADGRTPRGVLSRKSNDNSLVLTTEVPGIQIDSRFAWRLVTKVSPLAFSEPKPLPRPADPVPDDESDTGVLPAAPTPLEPVPQDQNPRQPGPPAPLLPESTSSSLAVPLIERTWLPLEAVQEGPVLVAHDALSPDHRRAVRSLNVRATVANWDRDAEIDGLLLHVQPLDGFGTVVPVDGVVDVQLATETKQAKGGRSDFRNDNTFSVPERWSVPIRAIDFDATGTTVKLPFRRFHPERDFDIASSALALAKLKLPTAGVFEASDPFVQLRPYSPFRDELQELRGQRLFPGEATPK